jgi:predicted metal-dependent peptidase
VTEPAAGRGEKRRLDRTKLLAARFRASSDRPYLATALYSLTVVEDVRVPTMGVDRQWRCYVSPDFVDRVPVDELAAVWIHEVSHLLRDHHGRADLLPPAMRADHHRVNVAQDLEINDGLLADGLRRSEVMRWPKPGPPRPWCLSWCYA